MVGAGSHVFAVWGYCISCADPEDHTVDLNPTLLATIIGESVERVEEAITFLTDPDPKSHCQDHEGRRLLPQGGLAYFLVTHEQYRNVKNSEELRQYFRENKRKQRLSKTVQDNIGHSQDPVCVSGSDKSTEGQQVIPHEGAAIPHVTPTLSRESREEESREKENANIVLTDDNCAMSSLDASSTNTKEEAGKLAVYFLEKTSASLKRKLVTSPAATAGGIRKLIQKDITPDEIKATIDWLCTVNLKREFSFQVHSGNSLYEKYDKIRGAMGTDERKRNTRRGPNI